MANSKSDKNPKVMDVAHPGKAAPSASSRPIIVSNRPILRQDPMMAPAEKSDKPTLLAPPSVSRVAKTVTVLSPLSAQEKEQLNTPEAVSASTEAKSEAGAAPRLVTVTSHPDISADKPVETVDKKEAAESVGREALESSGLNDPLMPDLGPEIGSGEPAPESKSFVLKPTSETKVNTDERRIEPPADATPKPPVEEITAAPGAAPKSETSDNSTSSAADASDADSDNEDDVADSDKQLAPNQQIDEAKRKQEEAEAAQIAEREQIIASKQYYLPVANVAARRGTARSVIILIVVLALAVLWLDAVLDAGILHIGGLQPLTHFFK